MKCTERTENNIRIISIIGELDVAVAQELRNTLRSAIEQHQQSVVIDMEGISFIDSSCLGVFVNAHKLAVQKGTSVYFAQPAEGVKKIFELTRTDKHLAVTATLDEAISRADQ